MRYYRCKCGESMSMGSMPPPRCFRCEKCGSNLAEGPSWHSEPLPHEWHIGQVETDEGMKPLSRCRYCHHTRREIQEAGK